MSPKRPLLICVVGPTAIGKTTLSIEIAKAFSTEIISADSRQFFKEMKIGTAVPSPDELAAVPHHFIQNKSILDIYSVGDFERESLELLEELSKKQNVLVMVGGSGLYVDAAVKGLDKFPEVSSEIRPELISIYKTNGIETLQKELKEADPHYYSTVDLWNHHRLIRALEIYRGTGKPFSSFLNKGLDHRNFDTLFIGLTAEREIIYDRINRRVDTMIADGLVEEAKALYSNRKLNALQTVGYRELFAYFDGTIGLEVAISEIKKNTRRFAKRQGTWFRKNEAINWFNYDVDFQEVLKFIKTSITK